MMKILFHLKMAAILKSGKVKSFMNLQINMVCSTGKLTGGYCGNSVKRKLGEEASALFQLFQIDSLDGDIYSGHIKSKRKLTVKPISLPVVLQKDRLFSSAIIKVVLPFGASWCSNYMFRLHSSNQEKYSKLLGDFNRSLLSGTL